jgi:hypothetical protein
VSILRTTLMKNFCVQLIVKNFFVTWLLYIYFWILKWSIIWTIFDNFLPNIFTTLSKFQFCIILEKWSITLDNFLHAISQHYLFKFSCLSKLSNPILHIVTLSKFKFSAILEKWSIVSDNFACYFPTLFVQIQNYLIRFYTLWHYQNSNLM